MFSESELQKWWESRSDDQRAHLKHAAQQNRLDAPAVKLLLATGCPVGPIGTRWESQPHYTWSWPDSVRAFITTQ